MNFKLICYSNFVQKIRKIVSVKIFTKLEKPHFGHILGPSNEDSSQKIIQIDFATLCYCNLMQKITKITRVDFSKNLKNLILVPFWILLAQKPLNKIFFKNFDSFIFLSKITPSFCAKIRKFLPAVPQKNSVQKNKRTGSIS